MRLVVDADTGEVVQELQYGAFGEVLVDSNPGFQPFGFGGGLWEFETGLVRFGARDYDAEVGRWTSKDPIGFGGGQANLYVFVAALGVPVSNPSTHPERAAPEHGVGGDRAAAGAWAWG